jgi:FMN-dependent NADH-azoreductase
MNILHLDSSIMEMSSVTRKLTASIVEMLLQTSPDAKVQYRDLVADPPPCMNLRTLPKDHPSSALVTVHSDAERQMQSANQKLLDEFVAADVVVLGAPMYNFGVASQLKSWFDAIVVPGRTFTYRAGKPVGLAVGKRIFAAVARGGVYEAVDHTEHYIRTIFDFLGVKNMEMIICEGLAYGHEPREKAIASAMLTIRRIFQSVEVC